VDFGVVKGGTTVIPMV